MHATKHGMNCQMARECPNKLTRRTTCSFAHIAHVPGYALAEQNLNWPPDELPPYDEYRPNPAYKPSRVPPPTQTLLLLLLSPSWSGLSLSLASRLCLYGLPVLSSIKYSIKSQKPVMPTGHKQQCQHANSDIWSHTATNLTCSSS